MTEDAARTLLQVDADADRTVLARARRARARSVHPDLGAGAGDDAPMQQVNEAYGVLLAGLPGRGPRRSDPVVCAVCDTAQEVPRSCAAPTCGCCGCPLFRLLCSACPAVRFVWNADAWVCACGTRNTGPALRLVR